MQKGEAKLMEKLLTKPEQRALRISGRNTVNLILQYFGSKIGLRCHKIISTDPLKSPSTRTVTAQGICKEPLTK